MRIIAFIEEDVIIQKILKHLGLWETRSHSPPPSCAYEETIYADEPACYFGLGNSEKKIPMKFRG